MAMATLSAKVDSNSKKEFEQFCEDTGMNVSVCINMSKRYSNIINCHLKYPQIHFTVKLIWIF